jgi:methylenetetrahydrofolate reductase (NADPH)
MRIVERLTASEPCFSFEFFPPHTEKGVDSLFRTVVELAPLRPGFVSCTSPGSATPDPDPEIVRRRKLTLELTRRIREESHIEAMPHITCSARTRDELIQVLDQLLSEGADNVLALRGDPPGIVDPTGGQRAFVATEGGFSHGDELVGLIHERGYRFCIGAACYPEKHQEAPDFETDLTNLKRKVDAGVDFLISQLYFDNRSWFRFEEHARASGISVPLVPGLMPITSRDGIMRMTLLSGATIPDELQEQLDANADDAEAIQKVGIEWTTNQARELLDHGVPGIHFYTLNKSRASREIVSALRGGES